MITIPLDPNIQLGPIMLAWHGIFTAVGIFFGVWLPMRLIRPRISEEDGTAIATWGVVGGILGARAFHVVDCWTRCGYADDPLKILFIWTGGIAIWGAAFGGVLGGLIVGIRRHVPVGFAADAAAPGLALGFAVGRIGDIINGEHHATACEAPWGICVGYDHAATLGQPGPVHLTVGYDLLWNATAVAGALLLRGRGLPDGLIFWLAAVWYGLGRLVLGFLRIDDPTYVFALRQDQVIGIIVIAASAPIIARLLVRGTAPATA